MNDKKIGMIAAWLYVFLVFVTSDSITLFIASLILFVGFLFCNRRRQKISLKLCPYFVIELFFVIYCLLQIVFGIAALRLVSWSAICRLLINCIDEFLLYNILIRLDNIEEIYKSLIYPYIAGLVIIILIQADSGSLFFNRLKVEVPCQLFGLTINAGAATLIGHCAVCAFAFSLICYYIRKNKRYLLFSIISFIALVLTSSRKALFVALVFIIVIPEIYEPNRKKIQRILQTIVILVLFIILIMHVPTLYNLVGVRLERMFLTIQKGGSVDYSMKVRDNLRVMAWDAFWQRPFWGWGVNSFKELFNNGWIYSHCNYLEILVGTGIIGTGLFFSKYLYLLKKLIDSMRLKQKNYNFHTKSLLFWFLMVLIMEYWQVSYYNERMIVHFIFILAILEKMKDSYVSTIKLEQKGHV